MRAKKIEKTIPKLLFDPIFNLLSIFKNLSNN